MRVDLHQLGGGVPVGQPDGQLLGEGLADAGLAGARGAILLQQTMFWSTPLSERRREVATNLRGLHFRNFWFGWQSAEAVTSLTIFCALIQVSRVGFGQILS